MIGGIQVRLQERSGRLQSAPRRPGAPFRDATTSPGEINLSSHMSQTAKRHRISDAERYQAVTAARERFLAGDDRVRGVRPEVATSWYRCREQYHVDPGLSEAPPASAQDEPSAEHTLEHEIVFAQLGGAAASIASEVESLGGVVTVTDGAGRILTVQGDKETLRRARDSNMAPWSCWSEWATGTNGMGTALEAPGPVLISGPEHWCTGFDEWVCAGVAVRDAVTARCRRGPRRLDLARQPSRRRRPGGCPRRWAARARSCASAPATAAPSWPRRSPRHERGPDRRSPPWTRAARSSSPTRTPASSSASRRACRRSTPRCAGSRASTSGASPVTPSSRLVSTTAGSARRRS